jgi:hypothetical protein
MTRCKNAPISFSVYPPIWEPLDGFALNLVLETYYVKFVDKLVTIRQQEQARHVGFCPQLEFNLLNIYKSGGGGTFRTNAREKTELTNFIELSTSWEAASCAATQEIHSILWNPRAHYGDQERTPLVLILIQR